MFYEVVVRHNLVQEIRHRHLLPDSQALLNTNLEAGTMLAKNFRQYGCVDAEYWFDDPERAKLFASVCMDFIKKLIESRITRIDKLNNNEEYVAENSSQMQ